MNKAEEKILLGQEMVTSINTCEEQGLLWPETVTKGNQFLKERKGHCGLVDTSAGQILIPDVRSGVGRAVVSIGSAQLRGADLLTALDAYLPDVVDLPDQGECAGSFAVCESVEGFYKLADLAGVWPANFPRPSSIAKAIERGSKTASRSWRYLHDSKIDQKTAGQPVVGLSDDADKVSAAEFWTYKKGKAENVSVFSAPSAYILGIAALEAAWRRQKPKKKQLQALDADGNVLIDEKIQALNVADSDILLAAVEAAKADLAEVKRNNEKLTAKLSDLRDKLVALRDDDKADKKSFVARISAICAELAD